jgi:hypothetical protein
MSREFEEQIGQQIETWTGVAPPNEAARVMAEQLAAVIQGFEALRGTMVFEDEPSSFDAALQATKE